MTTMRVVGECFFWYRLTRVFPDKFHRAVKRLCVDSVRDNTCEPVPDETFTHSNLSCSSVIPYQLSASIMIHGILPVQFTCITVFFHDLSSSFLRSISWPGNLNFILHTFLHPIIVFFSQYMVIPSQPALL